MLEREKIRAIIMKSGQEVNKILDKQGRLEIGKRMDIYGGKSRLDSLGLVNLLIDLEQRLLKEADIRIVMMDTKAFSLKNSPFKNIDTLIDFIADKGKTK